MSAQQTPSGTIYHGLWRENGGSEIAIEDEHGHRIGTVRHVPKEQSHRNELGLRRVRPD